MKLRNAHLGDFVRYLNYRHYDERTMCFKIIALEPMILLQRPDGSTFEAGCEGLDAYRKIPKLVALVAWLSD